MTVLVLGGWQILPRETGVHSTTPEPRGGAEPFGA